MVQGQKRSLHAPSCTPWMSLAALSSARLRQMESNRGGTRQAWHLCSECASITVKVYDGRLTERTLIHALFFENALTDHGPARHKKYWITLAALTCLFVTLDVLGNVAHVFDTSHERSIFFELFPFQNLIVRTWVCKYISNVFYRCPNSLGINKIFFQHQDPI